MDELSSDELSGDERLVGCGFGSALKATATGGPTRAEAGAMAPAAEGLRIAVGFKIEARSRQKRRQGLEAGRGDVR